MSRKHQKIRKKGLPPGTLIYTGDIIVDSPFVSVCRFSETFFSQKKSWEEEDFLQNNDLTTWIDVRGLSDVGLIEHIGATLKISPLVLEDVLDTQQRPKFEEYENGLLIIAPHLDYLPQNTALKSEQIALFFTKNTIASFQEDPNDTFDSIRARLADPNNRVRRKKSDYLANALLDYIVDNYYLVFDGIESDIETLEEQLFAYPDSPKIRSRIYQLKRLVISFRRKILPLRDACFRFSKSETPFSSAANHDYFRDVHDHVSQIIDSIDHQVDTLDGFAELSQAESSNRMGHVMRLLTIISTIFIPLSFVAGVYGMNFDNMPELRHPDGYYWVLTVMFLAAVGMLVYFKKKKWL